MVYATASKAVPQKGCGFESRLRHLFEGGRDILIIDQMFIYLHRAFSPTAAGTKMGRPLQECFPPNRRLARLGLRG